MLKYICLLFGMMILIGCSAETKEEAVPVSEDIFQIVETRNINILKDYLKKATNLNIQDDKGRTPLMIATYHNDVEMAKLLIETGADVNIQDDLLNNPFLYAGAEGYLDILKLTIKAGADTKIVNRYGGTALIPAAEHGYIEVIKELLEETDIDVNHVNKLGWTALLEAIILNDGRKRQQDTVQILIDYGADVNIADFDGVSPLQHAQDKGYREIEVILQKANVK